MNKDAYFPIPDTRDMTPLTLEQYNALSGRPVIVEKNTGKKWWAIAQKLGFDTCGYGQIWRAYAYPPAHIDREAWTGCVCDSGKKNCCTCVSMECHSCIGESKYKKGSYCSACGRPQTPEAWAMLEKRLRG